MSLLEIVNALTTAFKEDKDLLELLNETLNGCSEYVHAVNSMENCQRVLKFRLEPEDYKERLKALDQNRRILHNATISGIKAINRLCKTSNLPPLYEGDESDRYAIADFALTVTNVVFVNRMK